MQVVGRQVDEGGELALDDLAVPLRMARRQPEVLVQGERGRRGEGHLPRLETAHQLRVHR
jgi:hypothetical protein